MGADWKEKLRAIRPMAVREPDPETVMVDDPGLDAQRPPCRVVPLGGGVYRLERGRDVKAPLQRSFLGEYQRGGCPHIDGPGRCLDCAGQGERPKAG